MEIGKKDSRGVQSNEEKKIGNQQVDKGPWMMFQKTKRTWKSKCMEVEGGNQLKQCDNRKGDSSNNGVMRSRFKLLREEDEKTNEHELEETNKKIQLDVLIIGEVSTGKEKVEVNIHKELEKVKENMHVNEKLQADKKKVNKYPHIKQRLVIASTGVVKDKHKVGRTHGSVKIQIDKLLKDIENGPMGKRIQRKISLILGKIESGNTRPNQSIAQVTKPS